MRANHEALTIPPVFVNALQKLGNPSLDLSTFPFIEFHFNADVVQMNNDDVAIASQTVVGPDWCLRVNVQR